MPALTSVEHAAVLRETRLRRNAHARMARSMQRLADESATLRLTLQGVVSWARPREQPLKNGGRRTAYPPAYAAGRAVWQAQVRFAVARTGWRPRPVAQALSVEAEVVAKGKLDTDRVTTAILDALEGGGALLNDCRVWRLHVVRRVPRPDEAPHVEVVLGLLDGAPAPAGATPGGDDAEKPG